MLALSCHFLISYDRHALHADLGGAAPCLLILAFIVLILALILYFQFFYNRIPRLPRASQDWGSAGGNDPRLALAAMMYAVATEDGPLTPVQEQRILSQLTARVGLGPDLAPDMPRGR